MYEKYGNWSEMGPYGSVWGDIKTGKRSMAHDHFQTPPDPQKTGGSLKKRFGGSGSNRLIRRTTMTNPHLTDILSQSGF